MLIHWSWMGGDPDKRKPFFTEHIIKWWNSLSPDVMRSLDGAEGHWWLAANQNSCISPTEECHCWTMRYWGYCMVFMFCWWASQRKPMWTEYWTQWAFLLIHHCSSCVHLPGWWVDWFLLFMTCFSLQEDPRWLAVLIAKIYKDCIIKKQLNHDQGHGGAAG